MSYMALYRKFRPDVFDEVKGQDAIVATLRNQVRTGRTGHAYLFCVTRGPARRLSQRFSPKQSTANTRSTAIPAANATAVRRSPKDAQ